MKRLWETELKTSMEKVKQMSHTLLSCNATHEFTNETL